MKTILDIGRQGSENLSGFYGPRAEILGPDFEQRLAIIRKFPCQPFDADTADGVKKPVEVRTLLLKSSQVFDLVHGLAVYEPMVYAKVSGRIVLGMLSPNFDPAGELRLSSIKIIPLQEAYPLTSRLEPDVRMGTMLAGAASAERKGVGGHNGIDFEHQATILGAISLGRPDLAVGHTNHKVRGAGSSVATGLTNGTLGNLYVADTSVGDFPGYGEPIHIQQGSDAIIFFPNSFLDTPTSFGATYDDASRIMYGAGLQVLHDRPGQDVTSQINDVTTKLASTL